MLRQKTFVILCAMMAVMQTLAAQDSATTTYHKGIFTTSVSRVVDSPAPQTCTMVDSLVAQFQRDPELLYDWALQGTGQQHDGTEKDDIILILKSTTFQPKAHRSTMLFDAIVPGFHTFKDISIESIITTERTTASRQTVNLDMYTSLVLKHAHGVLTTEPLSDTQSRLTMTIDIKFGWFFNIFITQKKYRALAEFRIEKFMDNLTYYATHTEAYVK